MLFANKTTMDKKTCRDFLALCWPANAGYIRTVLLLVAAFSIFWSVFQITLHGWDSALYSLGILLMGICAVFLGQWGYLLRLKEYIATQQQHWGGETLDKEVLIFETEIIQQTKMGELRFKMGQVDGLLGNRNSLVIRMGPHAILIKRDGFTVGNEQECIQFLKEKIKQNKARKKAEKRNK